MFHLVMDSNSKVIFELAGIDLHNRFSISSQNSDLKKSDLQFKHWDKYQFSRQKTSSLKHLNFSAKNQSKNLPEIKIE